MSAFNHEMLMTCLPAAFEGAFAHMLFFLQRRGPDPNLDSLYRLLRLPGNSQPAADMFAKVSPCFLHLYAQPPSQPDRSICSVSLEVLLHAQQSS